MGANRVVWKGRESFWARRRTQRPEDPTASGRGGPCCDDREVLHETSPIVRRRTATMYGPAASLCGTAADARGLSEFRSEASGKRFGEDPTLSDQPAIISDDSDNCVAASELSGTGDEHSGTGDEPQG